jgi:electron transport complex protein RnfG
VKNLLKTIKPAIILFIICGITTAALAFANLQTVDKIAEVMEQAQVNARKQVLPNADSFKEINDLDKIIENKPELKTIINAYYAYQGNEIIGISCLVVSKGYGGDIKIIVGIDKDGYLQGVNIVEHNETPGLGTKADEDPFKSQFKDIDILNGINLIKGTKNNDNDVVAITGATITSKAVVKATVAAGILQKMLIERGN